MKEQRLRLQSQKWKEQKSKILKDKNCPMWAVFKLGENIV